MYGNSHVAVCPKADGPPNSLSGLECIVIQHRPVHIHSCQSHTKTCKAMHAQTICTFCTGPNSHSLGMRVICSSSKSCGSQL